MVSSNFATLAKYARALNAASGAGNLPALIFMTDAGRVTNPDAVISRLEPDCAVIIRDYDAPDRVKLARTLKVVCQARHIRFLIAGDPALAERLAADGIHMPEYRVNEIFAWRKAHPEWLITVASHSGDALREAHQAGADAALLSPVFATRSHAETLNADVPGALGATLGAPGFAKLADMSPLPVYAFGGVNARNASAIKGCQVAGIAFVSALSPD